MKGVHVQNGINARRHRGGDDARHDRGVHGARHDRDVHGARHDRDVHDDRRDRDVHLYPRKPRLWQSHRRLPLKAELICSYIGRRTKRDRSNILDSLDSWKLRPQIVWNG